MGIEGSNGGLTPTISSPASRSANPILFFMYLLHIYILDRKMRAAFYPHTMLGTFGIIRYENEIYQILEREENLRVISFHSLKRVQLTFGEVK